MKHCPVSRSIDDHLARLDQEDERAEEINRLVDEFIDDPARCHEADELNAGTFSDKHYTALDRALGDFGSYSRHQITKIIEGRKLPAHPEQLIRAIERLHELAIVHAEARRARLVEFATDQVDTGEEA